MSGTFVIPRLFVDDKQLPNVLRLLAGHIISMDAPQPVVNASVVKGKLQADSGGTMTEAFIAHIHKTKLTAVRTKDVKQFLLALGKSESSCQHVLKQAVGLGALKKKGKGPGTFYEVVTPKK